MHVHSCFQNTHALTTILQPFSDDAGNRYYRDLAVVVYLSKSWKTEYGGLFVDLAVKPPMSITPLFNSMVVFFVPRLHQVTLIADHCTRKRYSIFGWSLTNQALSSTSTAKKNKRKKRKKGKKEISKMK